MHKRETKLLKQLENCKNLHFHSLSQPLNPLLITLFCLWIMSINSVFQQQQKKSCFPHCLSCHYYTLFWISQARGKNIWGGRSLRPPSPMWLTASLCLSVYLWIDFQSVLIPRKAVNSRAPACKRASGPAAPKLRSAAPEPFPLLHRPH